MNNKFSTDKFHQENKNQVVDKLKADLIKDKIITSASKDYNEYYKNCEKLEWFEDKYGTEGRKMFDEWLKNK